MLVRLERVSTHSLSLFTFSVHRGKCRGQDVAVKLLHRPIVDEKNLAAFKREVAIMRYGDNSFLFIS